MLDLSTSLLGVFVPLHFQLVFTPESRAYYFSYSEPDEEVIPPQAHQDFSVETNLAYVVYFRIDDLCQLTTEYPFDGGDLRSECVVAHTPARWNYWHFSIRWNTHAGMSHTLGSKKKWLQRLCENARQDLHVQMLLAAEVTHCRLATLEMALG